MSACESKLVSRSSRKASAVKVVHFKSSDKHESSLSLRVVLNKSWHRLIRDTLVVRTLPTVSV